MGNGYTWQGLPLRGGAAGQTWPGARQTSSNSLIRPEVPVLGGTLPEREEVVRLWRAAGLPHIVVVTVELMDTARFEVQPPARAACMHEKKYSQTFKKAPATAAGSISYMLQPSTISLQAAVLREDAIQTAWQGRHPCRADGLSAEDRKNNASPRTHAQKQASKRLIAPCGCSKLQGPPHRIRLNIRYLSHLQDGYEHADRAGRAVNMSATLLGKLGVSVPEKH